MNSNLDKIAQDLYGKIQTRFADIKIGDENATVLSKKEDIPKARFFEFEYEENGEPLGTVAITLDAQDGVVVQVSGDLVNDDDDTTHHGAYKFLRSFRQFAKDRLLNFDIQNIGKSNLDKRDYHFQAKRKEEPVMAMPQTPVMESKMYGNNRMSYQDLGENTRLVVKHNQLVNLDLPAGRTMHIESIYIENAAGERFKYATKHLNGARALAEHIKHGGTPYDAIGKHITGLSEELASLRKFKGFVSRQEQVSEAMGSVTDRVLERIDMIKETIHKLQRPAYYESFAESFEEQEEQMIPEELQNDLIDRLTVRTFNEELKSVFPYIAKFVKESELPVLEIGADDLLSDAYNPNSVAAQHRRELKAHSRAELKKKADAGDEKAKAQLARAKEQDDNRAKEYYDRMEREGIEETISNPEDQFEAFMEAIVSESKDELFSPIPGAKNQAVDQLNTLLAGELTGGTIGVLALKGIIDDPELTNKIEVLDSDAEIRQEIKDYILDKDPQVLPLLTNMDTAPEAIGGQDIAEVPPVPAEPAPEVAPAPEAEPTAAVAPEPAPVAEDRNDIEKHTPKKNEFSIDSDKSWRKETPWLKTDIKKNPEGRVHNLAGQALKKSIAKAKAAGATLETQLDFGHGVKTLAEIIEECGMMPEEFGFEGQQEGGLETMLKYVAGFYNKEDHKFPLGATRIKIKVKKAWEDGEFGDVDQADVAKILKFIDAKDPSGDEQASVLKLAGVQDRAVDEEQGPNIDANMQDLENKIKGMKLNFGGQDIALNDPEQVGGAIKGALGGIMQGVQQQAPNQNVQVPGGQINPQEFMRAIMQKINGGQ
ncbi:hypothetical protein UFOVP181_403 [uncultured Caudovirales phage]|uniref:Large polyvalent protein-associated domain-containing protein n=1 Tax=uncultured Caudovirales phage TaxID=2100421 RepID=A0A6J5KX69_9CAUD|nr:hypothetical protein UFOVP57_236 [uncultured Caudovirales phage]CAB5209287.1 hypothetical protein UFOVP181_403 [uncultured Caudovirales phage]